MKYRALFFLALGIAGCAPPYSPELNTSAGLADQMTLLGTIGPVSSPDGSSTTAMKLLPVKPTAATTSLSQLKLTSGFLVSESPGRQKLSWVIQDSDGSVKRTDSNGGSFPLTGADPNYPLYQYEQIANNPGDILVFTLDPAFTNITVQLYRITLPNGPFQVPSGLPAQNMSDFAFSKHVFGVQVFPLLGADRFGFLFDNGAPLDGDGTTSFSGAGTIFATTGQATVNTNIQFPGTQKRALFACNGQTGSSYRGYASSFSAGQWACYRWDTTITPAALLAGVTRRIDAVLTDGDLVSTQDGTLTIYDSNGVKVNSVPLAGMQFCYEAYVGGTPYVFFSLSLSFPHESWALRAYAIPTSALRGLKG